MITSLLPELRIVAARSNNACTMPSTDKDKSHRSLLPASTKVTSMFSSETRYVACDKDLGLFVGRRIPPLTPCQ
ncbi:hypothetical protein DPMN_160763 [Dreissena polymorpha]|uniref:Uncharacterized protein n=1 Tax=Dreissena polymorpha TaxID=45954 RepID=A0A9D4ENG6_DREPO|nr:hypothetical protein DPMN_160763 [Dreissena polymorpha]